MDPPERGNWAHLWVIAVPRERWHRKESRSVLLSRLFRFHLLTKAITFVVHFKNVAAMSESIEEGCRHAFALEHLAPVASVRSVGTAIENVVYE